jgi:predicted component of type VI protein secretion system
MSKSNRILPLLLVILLLGCVVFPLGIVQEVQAEPSAVDDALSAEGLTLVALRNDTMDMNQDGEPDAIRVVVILNSSSDWSEIELRLYGLHKDKEVQEDQYMAFTGQSNASLVYDAWSQGEHSLRLEFVNQDGDRITSIQLPTYVLTPALKTPQLMLDLDAPLRIETGDSCSINRIFADETGPRYDASGTRTFSGAPFTVLDNQTILDCSHWPAGEYVLKEAYRNDLGQTAEYWLNLTIHNRPAPAFSMMVIGNENVTDNPCEITMIPNMFGVDFSTFDKIWTVQGTVLPGNRSTTYDCSVLPAGVHLITLEVINNEKIRTVHGVNLVRLPGINLSEEEAATLPSRSFGDETPTESVGWFSIGVLGLIVCAVVFMLLVRVKEESGASSLRDLGPMPMILPDGSPDAQGLPTMTDAEGILWRQHPDGSTDWWDNQLRIWHKW